MPGNYSILFCDVCRGAYQIRDGKQDQFYADHAHDDTDDDTDYPIGQVRG